MAGRGALLFVTSMLAIWILETSADLCDPVLWNPAVGNNPFESLQGKVVLVSLMKGYCRYCVHQAQLLQNLYDHRHQIGLPDLKMIIVNGGEEHSANSIDNLRNVVSFPVLQDSPNHILYSQVFQGQKDDTIIYDRCGQRAFFIPYPYSNLAANHTQRLLSRTHQGTHFCYCSLDNARIHRRKRSIDDATNEEPSTNTEPDGQVEESAAQYNFLECSVSDVVCQRFQNIFNRMNARDRTGGNQNRFDTRFATFVDQSDFNLENIGHGLSHGSEMGNRGSRPFQGRNHPRRQRQRLGLFTNV